MSRKKPQKEYITEVTKVGNGAKINAYKSHIGKKVKVVVIEKDNYDLAEATDDNWYTPEQIDKQIKEDKKVYGR